jgi:hypothetical protein
MTGLRAGFWVGLIGLAAYLTSLGNGFAYDDELIVRLNPVVTDGEWSEVLQAPYWHFEGTDGTLFRPVTIAAFKAQWALWQGSPLGFHAVNTVVHTLVSLGVLALLWIVLAPPAALAGGIFFAIHPVHVEAVANVVGLAELLAALMVVAAALLYIRGADWGPAMRGVRALGLVVMYLVGLGAKEIAVTLPAILILFEIFRPDAGVGLRRRLSREAPVFLALGAALTTYLAWRGAVLSSLAGETHTWMFYGVDTGERILSAVSVWPEYLRLLVAPVALSVDYGPPVIPIARGMTPQVFGGFLVFAVAVLVVGASRRRSPGLALGVAWIAVALLPVSNVFFPIGVLLAERLLYLPSVGAAFAVGSVAGWLLAHPRARFRQIAVGVLPIAALLLFARTVQRTPVWMSTFTVIQSLNDDQPESYYAYWKRAEGLARVGLTDEARTSYEVSVALAPGHYGLLCAASEFIYRTGDAARSESLLRRAIEVLPHEANAYQLLSIQLLGRGLGRQAHSVVTEGLARYGPERQLWASLAESYVAKGDLEAAARALRAAVGSAPGAEKHEVRLAQILDAIS